MISDFIPLCSGVAFTTGSMWQMSKAYMAWVRETLPVIRENEKLKCLLSLNGIEYKQNQSAPLPG